MTRKTGVFGYGETVYTTFSKSKDPPTAHWGVYLGVVKSLFLTDFWQIIVMMSETVGIDIHKIE